MSFIRFLWSGPKYNVSIWFGAVSFHIEIFAPEFLFKKKTMCTCKDHSDRTVRGQDNAVKYANKTIMQPQRAALTVVIIYFFCKVTSVNER